MLLDTNVVSALMAPAPPLRVVTWLDAQPSDSVHLSTVTVAEIAYGLAVLPDGRRRRDLESRFRRLVATGFASRVLPFDEEAAFQYGEIMACRRRAGRPMSVSDGQIAAIARTNHLTLATRNVRLFEETGIEVVDPFAE